MLMKQAGVPQAGNFTLEALTANTQSPFALVYSRDKMIKVIK